MKKLGIDPDAVSVPDRATADTADSSDTSQVPAGLS
jgi:hypothetical protein